VNLILSEADRPERKREVTTFPCLVGKAEDCGLRLQDKRLSDHHAVILPDGDSVRLIDLSSLNGTYVLQPEEAAGGKPQACPSVESPDWIPESVLRSAPDLRNGTTVAFGGLLYTCEFHPEEETPQTIESPGDGRTPPRKSDHRPRDTTQAQTGFRLAITGGPESGRTVTVQRDTALLGSDSRSADISFSSNLVSRRHARLHRNGRGQLVIEDLQSKNGTFVQGKRLTSPAVLKPGTEVSLGHGTVFHVEDCTAPGHSRVERALLFASIVCVIVALGVVVLRSGRDDANDATDAPPAKGDPQTREGHRSETADIEAVPPASPESPGEEMLREIETRLGIELSWNKDQLIALQNRLRSVSEPALRNRKAELSESIRKRMLSLQSLEKVYGAVRMGEFDEALKRLRQALEQDIANPWAAKDVEQLSELRPLLARVAAEAGYDSPDETRIGGLVREILENNVEQPLRFALRGYLESRLGGIASAHFQRAERLLQQGKPVDALAALRAGLNLMPWEEQGMQMLAALEKEAKPELESLLIRAYQLESNRDAESREQAASMYRRILDICSPLDWTARFHEKARRRVE
jgi:pSer/pThr/pTyr-binding forkhead associated (FHA) protein/tetratricopeptide (TPR) repeat protein